MSITIKMLSKNRKLIPIIYTDKTMKYIDLKLPDLVVTNDSAANFEIHEVTLNLLANNRKVVTLMLSKEDLLEFMENNEGLFKAYAIPHNEIPSLKIRTGEIFSYKEAIRQLQIPPGKSTILFISFLRQIKLAVRKIIEVDMLNVVLQGKQVEDIICSSNDFPILNYTCKGQYIFPIKGDFFIGGLPLAIGSHRECFSQEFAFDIGATGSTAGRESKTYRNDKESAAEDINNYYIYNREVHAASNGIICRIGDQFDEGLVKNPLEYSREKIKEITNDLEKKLGVEKGSLNGLAGNYIVIDHENGEYSFYAHLRKILVIEGQKVTQGTVIGHVGNTGNSTEPHLHFQLMDGEDFFTAHGLPIMFTDISLTEIDEELQSSNTILPKGILPL